MKTQNLEVKTKLTLLRELKFRSAGWRLRVTGPKQGPWKGTVKPLAFDGVKKAFHKLRDCCPSQARAQNPFVGHNYMFKSVKALM